MAFSSKGVLDSDWRVARAGMCAVEKRWQVMALREEEMYLLWRKVLLPRLQDQSENKRVWTTLCGSKIADC